MAYQPITNFGVKDTLGPDNPDKIIYGADLQVEFDAISENLESVGDELIEIGDVVEEAPSDNVVYGRKNDEWVSVALESGGVNEAPLDGKSYTRKDAGWSEANYAAVDASYTKSESDGKYAAINASYTKPESDGKYAAINASYTKSESDSKYAAVGSSGSVDSVNGQSGVVTLTYTDVGAAPTGDYATNAGIATSVKSKRFVETVREPRYQGQSAILELDLANNFTMNFLGMSGYMLGLSGAPSAAGDAYGFTLTLDTTLMDMLAWDDKIKWSTGTAPTLEAGVTYVFTFLTTDGGSTFKGFVGGEAFA